MSSINTAPTAARFAHHRFARSTRSRAGFVDYTFTTFPVFTDAISLWHSFNASAASSPASSGEFCPDFTAFAAVDSSATNASPRNNFRRNYSLPAPRSTTRSI